MNFGEILSKAWQIIWKHKVLWIFGILAGCGNASGSVGNIQSTASQNGSYPLENYFNQMPDDQIVLLVLLGIMVIFVLSVIAIFLSTVGKIGLIRGTQNVEAGAASLVFGDLFSGSMPYFWRVFLLNLLVGLVILVFVIGLAIVIALGAVLTLGIGAICILPLICVLIPIGWLVQVVVEQATVAIVVENLGVMDGLRRGWELVRANLGNMIVMALILYLGVGLIGGFVIGLPVVLIVLPALAGIAAGAEAGGLLVAGLCFVAYLPVLLVLGGVLAAFTESAWTLTFLRLSRPAVASAPWDTSQG